MSIINNNNNDQCGSDHFPIIIQQSLRTPTANPQRWKLLKAMWDDFNDQCSSQLTSDQITRGGDNIEAFTKTLIEIASIRSPKLSRYSLLKVNRGTQMNAKKQLKTASTPSNGLRNRLLRATVTFTEWPVPNPDAPFVTISAC